MIPAYNPTTLRQEDHQSSHPGQVSKAVSTDKPTKGLGSCFSVSHGSVPRTAKGKKGKEEKRDLASQLFMLGPSVSHVLGCVVERGL